MVRGTKILAVVTCSAAMLAACGKAPNTAQVDTAVNAQKLAASADHTTQAGSAKVDLTMTLGSGAAGSTTLTGHGAYDGKQRRSSIVLDLGPAVAAATNGSKGTAAAASGASEEVRTIGDVGYVRVSAPAGTTAFGDTWIKIDAEQMRAMGGAGGLGGVSFGGDPSTVLGYLKGAGADVTTVGHEQVRGVDTTHARARISMGQALDAAGRDRDKLRESLAAVPGLDVDAFEKLTMPVDVYLDADGYVRRLAIALDLTAAMDKANDGSRATSSIAMTVDYHDFGVPVTVEEPPADQTQNICDALANVPASRRAALPPGVC